MENCFYFDTSIWIDIYDKRGYNGEVAAQLLENIILEDDVIFYSDVVFIEFKRVGFSDYEINQVLSIAKPDHLQRINSTKVQMEEAKRLAAQRQVPLRDALHAVLARDHEAQLVSRDGHFQRLKDITIAQVPENLI